jgi:hypothetical protein
MAIVLSCTSIKAFVCILFALGVSKVHSSRKICSAPASLSALVFFQKLPGTQSSLSACPKNSDLRPSILDNECPEGCVFGAIECVDNVSART